MLELKSLNSMIIECYVLVPLPITLCWHISCDPDRISVH